MSVLYILLSILSVVATPKTIVDSIPLAGMSLVIEQAIEMECEAPQNSKTMNIGFPEEELEVLYRIVEAEATGGSVESKRNVAHVILNRVSDPTFPNTIEDVVFQKNGNTYQFSPIKDGRFWSVEVSEETKTAVHEALEGEDTTNGALYFCQYSKVKNKKTKRWFDSMTCTLVDDIGHRFYK